MTTPPIRMVPVEGQSFSSEQDWINRAKRVLTSHPSYNNTEHAKATGWRGRHFTALCFDQAGRRVRNGGDFKRATDEETYPVWWVWPDQISALLTAAPVREEGGAVDPQIIKRLQAEADDPGITDSVMVFGPDLRALLRAYASLATREEAPAEAGENVNWKAEYEAVCGQTIQDREAIAKIIDPKAFVPMEDVIGMRKALSKADAILALRAQPPAREDAQPVGTVTPEAIENLKAGGSSAIRPPHHAGVALYTRPAPDALRVAVEALEPFAAFGRFEAAVAAQAPDIIPAPDDSVFKHWADAFDMKGPKLVYGDLRRAASVLADLQAEQKGGA